MWLVILLFLSIAFIVLATAKLKMHPFLALLLAAFGFGVASRMPLLDVVNAINGGFGDTVGYIGIVILAGAIIGTFLERSGGAYRLAERTITLTGERNVPAAMAIIGYVVSMPVFCDSAFVLLSSLNKALARRAEITLAASAIALSLGLYATHTMVPPTPGPVAAAGILEADLGLVILWGLVISLLAAAAGWLFAVTVAARTYISPEDEAEESTPVLAPTQQGPSVGNALMPIIVPIVLIVLGSVSELPTHPFGEGRLVGLLSFLGQPVVALLIGVLFALLLPVRFEKSMLSVGGWVGDSIATAAPIIIITGAGGAFGKVLQGSGVADIVGESLAHANLGIWLPFLIAAGIKTAQGSSTVALVTTAGLLAPLLAPLGLETDTGRALTVVAIGAGAMVVSHANDSYFWVVCQFSKMNVQTGYRLQTVGSLVEGAAAAVALWAVSLIVL